jgi:hypothetical protein
MNASVAVYAGEDDDVPDDERPCINVFRLAVPDYCGPSQRLGEQGTHRAARRKLRGESQRHVDRQHGDDGSGVEGVA